MSRPRTWSYSPFANWLRSVRGLPPSLRSGTWDEWAAWESNEKSKAPLLHWFLDNCLDRAEGVMLWPLDALDSVRWFVRNRFFVRLHMLPTGAKAFQWMELDERILYGCFNGLAGFVEIELAEMQYICYPEWFSETGVTHSHWPWWRSSAAGVAWLQRQAGIAPDHEEYSERQVESAKETLSLSRWWSKGRPSRPDPMEASGLAAIYAEVDAAGVDVLSDKFERSPAWLESVEKSKEIEDRYDAEDTDMLIRLIKIRQECWT